MTCTRRTLTVATLICVGSYAAMSFGATTTTTDGGSIQTKLSANIVLNKESGLRREWVVVHDDTIPVDLVGSPGVTTIYESGGRYSSGGYRYRAAYTVRVAEPVVAIEVRFITFDVWGKGRGP